MTEFLTGSSYSVNMKQIDLFHSVIDLWPQWRVQAHCHKSDSLIFLL